MLGTEVILGLFGDMFKQIWWAIPLAFVILFFMAKINKAEKKRNQERRAAKKIETKQKEKSEAETAKKLFEKFPDLKYVQNDMNTPNAVEELKQVSKKREYSPEEKKAWGAKQKELKDGLIEKGSNYELFVADHYRSKGYDVLEHGKEYGKLDKGIDLIAKKENEIIIIQCKNWKAGGKFTVDHAIVKEFIGNVATFLDKNAIYKDYIVKKIFAVSERVLDKSAMEFITANKQTIRYLHLPMKDSNPEG